MDWGGGCLPDFPFCPECRYPGHISIFPTWLSGHVEEAQLLPVRGSPRLHPNQQVDGVHCQQGPEQRLRSNSRQENVGWHVLILGQGNIQLRFLCAFPRTSGPPSGLCFGLWLNCRYLNAAWVSPSILKSSTLK